MSCLGARGPGARKSKHVFSSYSANTLYSISVNTNTSANTSANTNTYTEH